MKWFGESWGAPACDPDRHVDTPVGEKCLRCQRAIAEDDQGFMMPLVTMTETTVCAYHVDCLIAAVTPCGGCELCATPPAVHILRFGWSLCLFSRKVPGEWPEGHTWVSVEDAHLATCARCKESLAIAQGVPTA